MPAAPTSSPQRMPRSWPEGPARDAALILDFDGTLAPIVDDPTAARMPSRTASTLARLRPHLGTLAIVSGRPVSYLQRWAPVPGVTLVGLYGMERLERGEIRQDPRVASYASAVAAAKQRLESLSAAMGGLYVEDKGATVALHWRRATSVRAAEAKLPGLIGSIADELGLAVEGGKMVAELRPPIDLDKGDAVRSLIGAGDAAYAGDDIGDLPALKAVRAAGGLSIVVAHGQETAAELHEAADIVIDGPEVLVAWLQDLADTLEG